MELITLILQIVTIVISLFSIIFNIIHSSIENKKAHYLEIVTKQRLKNKENIQNAAQTLLKYSHPEMLETLTNEQIIECIEATSIISTIFKYIYPQERELINYSNQLIAELKNYKSNKNNSSSLFSVRKAFFIAYSAYDAADWSFIKQQASGTNKDSQDFDFIYLETLKNFKKDDSI